MIPLLLLAALIGIYGCGGEKGYSFVDFTDTVAVEIPKREPEKRTLKVAIAAMISSKSGFYESIHI